MRNVAAFRIAMWAIAGFVVSAGWALYFASTSKALPIEPAVYNFASMTQPLVAGVLHLRLLSQLDLMSVAVANAGTYALVGLLVEAIRQQPHRRVAK